MKNRKGCIFMMIVIIMTMMACSLGDILPGGGTEEPVVPSPIDVPAGGVEILSTSSFTDNWGGFYVVGEVANNLDTPITSIELSVSITDDSGATLLTDDNGAPVDSVSIYSMLWTLDAGETSPFSYYYSFDETKSAPANYEVSVLNYEAGSADRGDLDYSGVQIIDDGSGYFILTGELMNLSESWVHINGLAGGVLDDANTVLSADWTGTYTTLLAPAGDESGRDKTPFYINFPVPTIEATQWSIWWDADIETDVTDFPLGVGVTYSYFDEFGSVHLVGIMENYGDTPLSSLVVAGLYAEDGTVLDASYSFLPAPVLPGGSIPFDISYFGSVNWNEEQAALVSTYSVQFDPWSTYPPFYETVALAPAGESIEKNGTTWSVTGNFTNTTSQSLSGVTIIVAVYDPSNTLVAVGYTYSYPTGDVYAPGDGGTYEINLYLDPDADLSGYTTQTLIIADISE
jgi:hypothetical protein